MAGSEALLKIFASPELEPLSQSIKEKLEVCLSTKDEELDEFKKKYERLRVNSEQQYFELEKKLINSSGQLEAETSTRTELQYRLSELEKKYDEANSRLKEVESSHQSLESNQKHIEIVSRQLEAEKRELNTVLEKRTKEVAALNEDITSLTDKATALSREKCEVQAKLGEVQSQEVSREYREKRLKEEKDHLQKQIDWLNGELKNKTNDLINVKKERASKQLEVQAKLDEKTDEVNHQNVTCEALKKSRDEQAQRIDTFIQKLKDARDAQTQSDEQFRQEITAQSKLVQLYKVSSEESETKVTELTRAVEELQKLLKEASQAHTTLQDEKGKLVDDFKTEVKTRDLKVEKLEQELKNANEVLMAHKGKGAGHLGTEALEALAPTAAATSKILKSGMTLTQIYNEYVVATESLQLEQEENKRLNEYLDQILQEIEERAPMMRKQREDYERSLQTTNQLTTQLDTAMLECEKLRRDGDESRRKFSHFQRESHKYQQQTIDLGQQVRYLVKEVEELRGGRVVRDEDVSSEEVSSSSSLISEKLVTFKNIEDLQTQNQRLLGVVRELGDKREEEEKQATDAKILELKQQLEIAQGELEELRSAKCRQAEMVESIVRQRDMYRVLLQQGGQMPTSISPMMASTPLPGSSRGMQTPVPPQRSTNRDHTPTHPSPASGLSIQNLEKSLGESQTALRELQAEFTTYRKERNENERLINQQLDQTKQELSDMRVQNAKLASQLDFSGERYKVLQGNADGYRKEVAALRNKNQQYATAVVKHEQVISQLREDLMAAQENSNRLDVQNDNLKAEISLLKSSEQRLMQELEGVRREQLSQNLLLSNLQAIQNNLERAEFETKTRLNNQISGYEREINSLKRKQEVQAEEHRTLSRNWENLVKNLQVELDREKELHTENKTKMIDANKNLLELKRELSCTEAKLVAAENKLTRLGQGAETVPERASALAAVESSEEVKDLKSEIIQLQNQIKFLKNQLETNKKHADQYKEIADNVEETLKEQNKTSKEFQQTLEKRSEDLRQSKEQLEKRIESMEKERQELLNENIRITEESHSLNADLRKQLASLQNELQESIQRREAAISNEDSAKRDYQQQVEIAADAQSKYERELMLHAADVEVLTVSKKKIEDFNKILAESQEHARRGEETLKESQTSWNEQERILREDAKMLEKRTEELTKQNQVLHEQMRKLSGQMTTMQRRTSSSVAETGRVDMSDDTVKSSEQLLEVIRFLRRDKEIAETKLEMTQAEATRVNQRFAHLQKQIEDANKALAEERTRSQVSVQTAAQHADLMRKVENMNVLTDSNRLLREERDKLHHQLQELEAKMKKLEGDIYPLQSSIRGLQAQRDTAAAEKTALQNEVDRWKSRTNHLIEQANKSDPEEHRRTVMERDNLKRQLSQVNEERHKHRAELTRLNSNLASSQAEINNTKTQIGQLNVQIVGLKKQLEEKLQDAEEKTKTINQLKKIGRKYKEQAENVGKDLEQAQKDLAELKTISANQEAAQPNIAAMEQATTELRQKLAAVEQERNELKQQAQQKDTQLTEVKGRFDNINQERTQMQETIHKLREEVGEYEKKQNHSRSVLQTAKNKLTNQREQVEKLTSENAELKKRLTTDAGNKEEQELRLGTLKSQYEGRINRLEKEVQDARAGQSPAVAELQQQLDRLQKENTELQARVQALQKQLESQQKHITQPASIVTRPAATTPPSTSTSDQTPKMANIKPMATGTTSVGQATPIPHSSAAAAKATASIRPMAIAPTSVPSTTSSATPTATVMPTTVTPQDTADDELPQVSAAPAATAITSVTVSGRLQQVQIVTPQVESALQDPGTDLVEESSAAIVSAQVQQQQQQQQPPQITPVSPHLPSTSSGADTTAGITQTIGKRHREETESQEETETQAKRTRTQQGSPLPTITLTDENAQTVNLEAQEVQTQQVQMMQPAVTMEMGLPAAGSHVTRLEEVTQQPPQELFAAVEVAAAAEPAVVTVRSPGGDVAGEEVIVLGSDDDGADQNTDEEYGDEEDDEYAGDDNDATEDQGDDDNDVVIIDIDDSEQSIPSQQPPSGPSPVIQQPILAQQPAVSPRPSHSLQAIPAGERLPSVSGRAHLTPFMLGGQPGPFEDEDCTVPSTPTLSVPRRGDGFAEALNSPQVCQRFVFGQEGSLSQPELAQLESQRALGMDDTRMDLSQFDDGGRSMPTTPSQASALVTLTESQPEITASTSDTPNTGTPQGEESATSATKEQDPKPNREEIEEAALLEGDVLETAATESPDTGETKHDASGEGGEKDVSTQQEEEEEGGVTSSQATDGAGGAKPRIQRIVWEGEGSGSFVPSPAAATQAPQVPPFMSASQPVRGGGGGAAPIQRGYRRPPRHPGHAMRGRGGPWRPARGQPRNRPTRGNYRSPQF